MLTTSQWRPLSAAYPQKPSLFPKDDSKHWNSIIKLQTKLKDDHAILTTYIQMEALGISPDNSTLPLVLKACAKLQAVERGRKLHCDIQETKMINDVRVRTALIDFYCKCALLEDARHLFDEMIDKDVVSWNAMISGYVGCSCYYEAIELFMQMKKEKLKPNSVTVVALLSACGELLEMSLGKEIHGYCLRNGLFHSYDPHVGTALVGFYFRFDASIALLVFEKMIWRNIVGWNAMISGYFDVGDSWKALVLFMQVITEGVSFDSITLLVAIQACTESRYFELGRQVHQLAIKFELHKDLYILNALVNMYSKNGGLESSRELFKSMPTKDVALWNSMISAYADFGLFSEATNLFSRMRFEGVREDERTIVILLSLWADSHDTLTNCEALHAHVIKNGMERNTQVGNALLDMYAKLNCDEDVLKVFGEIRNLDVISWNILILTWAGREIKGEAWELFGKMRESNIKPNSHTIISILASCEDETFLCVGRSIHGYVIKHGIEINPSLNTALTEMYMNGHDEATARKLFEGCRDRDLISWNSLIGSYIKIDQAEKALLLFLRMFSEVRPNSVTIINILSSCTHLGNLSLGQCLHAYAIKRDSSWGLELSLANAFITMYARCGTMHSAERVFRTLLRRNIVSWNAIIAGYGMHGCGYEAMLAFSQMLEDGFKPNGITFISALSACSHSGLIEEGMKLFQSMVQDFYITPQVVHCACMVDLLARGGCLDEAKKFIDSMPIEPDASVWRSLLAACRVYSETKLAKHIFSKLINVEPTNAGNYVLLSNIYASAGLWSEVKKLRIVLEEKGYKKPPGKSWLVVRSKVHSFTAGDRSHPQSDKVYEKLGSLLSSIKRSGYVPDLSWALHDEDDDEKLKRLLGHSEKLAISFGLINVRGGAPILITKNLRVCGDCHEFSKYVSKVVGREIVLRDGSRFHHFVNGLCSCKDYWTFQNFWDNGRWSSTFILKRSKSVLKLFQTFKCMYNHYNGLIYVKNFVSRTLRVCLITILFWFFLFLFSFF